MMLPSAIQNLCRSLGIHKISRSSTRMVSLDSLSNKRITRLESDVELEDPDHKSSLINRNPRNLELLLFEKKPSGFWLDKSSPRFWNILVLEQDSSHQYAYLRHWSGTNLVEATTCETKLTKYFNSPTSTQAASLLAQVLARRCLQSGFITVGIVAPEEEDQAKQKTKIFYETAKSCGLTLEELPEITPRSVTDI